MIVLLEEKSAEIVGIAVSKDFKNNGIGSALINHIKNTENLIKITAQTDGDAIGFYQKNRFNTTEYIRHW